MSVHQITEHTGDAPAKGKDANTVYARCGAKAAHRSGKDHPKDFTLWGSDVTCKDCK